MGDLEHQHHQLAVLDIANQPGVAHAVAPQALASLPGVLSCRLAVSEIRSVQAKLCHHIVQAVGLLLP
jgi:hypothetical protein